ncbi:UV-damaged DNA-binding protein rad7 [Pleosporales sp. CAS-2024a]
MPRRRGQVHAYGPNEINDLMNVELPPRIKCGRCDVGLPPAKYSTKQLTDLRFHFKTQGNYDKRINCQKCTGQPIVEIECIMCHKTKGILDFAKSQRTKPDDAKCYACIAKQVSREPVNHRAYEEGVNFRTPDHSNGATPEYWTTAGSDMESSGWASVSGDHDTHDKGGVSLSHVFDRAMSISGSTSGTLISTDIFYPGGSANTSASSQVRSGESWRSPPGSTAGGSANTGDRFKPNAYGRAAAASTAGTQRTYPSSVAEYSDAATTSRFARIRAYKADGSADDSGTLLAAAASNRMRGAVQSPFVRPSGDEGRELDAAWHSDSEEEDNDDDDSDSDGENTVV